jgi:hypothetical protein
MFGQSGGSRSRVATVVALAAVAVLAFAAQAQGATFTVGTTSDTSPGTTCATFPSGCSLRQLIEHENGLTTTPIPPDTIVVPAGFYPLSNGQLTIGRSVTVAGANARTTQIFQETTSATSRVFDIQVCPPGVAACPSTSTPPTVTISGLGIFFGKADSTNGFFGGNVRNQGNLTLSEDLITDGNTTHGSGAGVSNDGGTLTVTHSLVSNNGLSPAGSTNDSGGIQNFGPNPVTGTPGKLVVIDSTIYNNAAAQGGGIMSWSDSNNATTVTNSTIVGNDGGARATNGGGLRAAQGTISVENSIVAGNTVDNPTTGTASNCGTGGSSTGAITSLGHNLDSGTDCGFTATGDIQGIDPNFISGSPQNLGGDVDVLALRANSPAVDAVPAGAPNCGGTDQRNIARPQGTRCDIGAYELQQPVEGLPFSGVVGAAGVRQGTTPSINWGDGSAPSPGQFDSTTQQITGSHTYAEEGEYHGSFMYTNSDGISSGPVPFDVKVSDAAISAAGTAVNAIAGKAFSGQVATLIDGNPLATVADFVATINWGDGTPASVGTISAGLGGFVVNGTHTYSKVGSYTTTTSVVDTGGSSASTQGPATVSSPPTPVTTGPPSVKSSTSAVFAGSVNPDGSPTTAHFEYGLDSRYTKPGTSGPVYDHSTADQTVGSDFSSHPVSESVSGLVPSAIYHVRLVATNTAGTTNGPDVTFTTPKDPAPNAPTLGKSFNVSATGLVLIKLHGMFVPLTELRQIPNGTIINALHGTLTFITAAPGGTQHATLSTNAKRKKRTKTQSGKFGGAVFKVTQSRNGPSKGLATLALVEGAFKGAPSFASCKAKKRKAVTAALSSRTLQLLHGSAHGKFRTKGRYAAATVRGTIWTIADRCDGTLTHAIKDTVTVNDFVRHKTIILRAGHRYLALAKPPHKRK